jgi:hypothetical protein
MWLDCGQRGSARREIGGEDNRGEGFNRRLGSKDRGPVNATVFCHKRRNLRQSWFSGIPIR